MKNLILFLIFSISIPLTAKAQGILLLEYKIDSPDAGYEISVYEREGVGEIYALKEKEYPNVPKLSGLGFDRLGPPKVRNLTEEELQIFKNEIKLLKKEAEDPSNNVELPKDSVIGKNYSASLRVYPDGPSALPVVVMDIQPKPKKKLDQPLKNNIVAKPEHVILLNTLEAEKFYRKFLQRVFEKTPENVERATLIIPKFDDHLGKSIEWCNLEMGGGVLVER